MADLIPESLRAFTLHIVKIPILSLFRTRSSYSCAGDQLAALVPQGSSLILDICLDFFSTGNPFLAEFREHCGERICHAAKSVFAPVFTTYCDRAAPKCLLNMPAANSRPHDNDCEGICRLEVERFSHVADFLSTIVDDMIPNVDEDQRSTTYSGGARTPPEVHAYDKLDLHLEALCRVNALPRSDLEATRNALCELVHELGAHRNRHRQQHGHLPDCLDDLHALARSFDLPEHESTDHDVEVLHNILMSQVGAVTRNSCRVGMITLAMSYEDGFTNVDDIAALRGRIVASLTTIVRKL